MPRIYFDGDTFERNGRTFAVEFPYDDRIGPPWEWSDNHGPVSDWTSRAKSPGERVLNSDRNSHRYYDFQEAMRIARRDGWGLCEQDLAKLEVRLGRKPSKGDICAAAVEADFKHLRRWCNGQWSYVGVVVRLVSDDVEESESLWGIESDAYEYLADVAHELADEINARLDDEMAADITASRPDMYQPHA